MSLCTSLFCSLKCDGRWYLGNCFKFRGLYWKFLVRVVGLVSSLVLLTRKQLVCCGWYVGLGVGLCLELLLRWCAPSEDVEFHQVSELRRELIFSWEECSREHNRHYALLLWWTSSGHRLMRAAWARMRVPLLCPKPSSTTLHLVHTCTRPRY